MAQHMMSGEMRAIKIIRKSKIPNTVTFMRELTVLLEISHPNILHFHEVFEDVKKFYLVFELCKGGDLLDRIVNSELLSEPTAANVFQ